VVFEKVTLLNILGFRLVLLCCDDFLSIFRIPIDM